MDKSTHDVRARQWTQIIEQCQSRPVYQTAKQWLQENGIKPSVYYYWQRKLRSMAYEEACTEITPIAESKPVAVAKAEEDVAFAEIPFSLGTDTKPETPQKDYLFQPTAVIKTDSASVAFSNDVSSDLISEVLKVVMRNV